MYLSQNGSISKCCPDIQALESYVNQQLVSTKYGIDSKDGRLQYCNSNIERDIVFQRANDQ
jgi:hypothetical protein